HLTDHFAPELIIVAIGLPGLDGIEVVRKVRSFSPATQMIMLTIHEDSDRIFEAICAGACGYLLKTATPDEIVEALREARGGGAPMTPQIARRVLNLFTQLNGSRSDYGLTKREKDVLAELIEGKTKKDMGKALFLSSHTVDTHLRNIYTKLHVHSRTEAVVKALKERLI
ncbi:MAG: LuxR C-terminal-related transcriptional regulator, partial [Longimicrobiales bacterium]